MITIVAPHSTDLLIKYTSCVKINFTELKRAFLCLLMKHPILANQLGCVVAVKQFVF